MRAYLKLAKAIEKAKSIPPCMNTDPELWYGDKDEGYHYTRTAKQLCSQCPVQTECLTYALEAREVFGIWGGMTPKERQALRSRRMRPNAA